MGHALTWLMAYLEEISERIGPEALGDVHEMEPEASMKDHEQAIDLESDVENLASS